MRQSLASERSGFGSVAGEPGCLERKAPAAEPNTVLLPQDKSRGASCNWLRFPGVLYYVVISRACHGSTMVGRPGRSYFHVVGRGPARTTNFLFNWPQPGPTNQFFKGWVADRPGPLNLYKMGCGPARSSYFQRPGAAPPGPSIFLEDGPRPGPADRISD